MCWNAVFQALESEIIAHEPLIDSVASTAQRMMQAKHFASENVKVQLDKLQSELQELQELTMARKLKLQASLESQTVCSSDILQAWLLQLRKRCLYDNKCFPFVDSSMLRFLWPSLGWMKKCPF